MSPSVAAAANRVRSALGRDYVDHVGVMLPPPRLRFCGPDFQDDAVFLASARAEAERLREHLGVGRRSRVLDFGCGAGRLAIGLLDRVGEVEAYRGVDVNGPTVRWCRGHIERRNPSFRFVHLDVANPRYNPRGRSAAGDRRLPFGDAEFDVAYLYSVFSHLEAADVEFYAGELGRLVEPGGRVFLTAFVEEGVPAVEVNPPGYRREWSGPLHCVRYERSFLEGVLARGGLVLERMEQGVETDGQSGLYLTRAGRR